MIRTRTKSRLKGRAPALFGLVALLGSVFAVLVAATPAGASSNGTTTYEADCVGTGAAGGQVAPFIVSLTANGTPDNAYPVGASFGAAGAASLTVPGAVIAGVEQQLPINHLGAAVADVVSSTDGTANGSYNYSHSFPLPAVGDPSNMGTSRQVSGASWTTAATDNLTSATAGFTAADIGDSVAGPAGSALDPSNAFVITAVSSGTTATALTAVGFTPPASAGSGTIGLGQNVTFTDTGFDTGPGAFTTLGTVSDQSNVGVTSVSEIDLNLGGVPVTFGGAAGTGPATCLETGWAPGPIPGPAQTGKATPLTPPGTTTALVSAAPVFPAAAFVTHAVNPPAAGAQAVNLGVGGSKTVTLNASAGSNPTSPTPGEPAVASCTLVPGSISDARLAVTIDASPNICSAHLTDSGSGVGSVTFQYTATDDSSAGIGGPFTSSAGTVTVTIGTPPVDQQINQDVNAGQLVLSCSAPVSAVTTCPLLTIPAITLNGLQQTTHISANTIYVSDNRGDPAVGWDLSTYMVTTPSNPNSNCATATDFCNSSVGSHVSNPNGHIASGNLSLSGVTCGVFTGNLNVAPTADAGAAYSAAQGLCHAAAGISGGTFTFGGQFNLVIPSSVYAGTYMGTVEYLVS